MQRAHTWTEPTKLWITLCPAAMPVDVTPVINDWMNNETVIQRAAVYKLMNFELGTSPEAAEAHCIVIGPAMKHLGVWVAFATGDMWTNIFLLIN